MKKEPSNYSYWKTILDDEDKVREFMVRGSARQKKEIKECFQYIEYLRNKNQQDFFAEQR